MANVKIIRSVMAANTELMGRSIPVEPTKTHYDVVIVGSGAGGGSLARSLA